MELRKNGRNLCALTQELPGIALQCVEEIVNRTIDVSAILPTMAFDVLRVGAIDTDMHTVPSTMAALWTSGTTLMSVQVLAFLIGCHGFISLCLRDATTERRQESARLSL